MAASKKTDNHDPRAKLLLRRYFLDKYHADGNADVLDCCQAGGLLWTEICKTHQVARYWGVDLKPKKGRLKIDSVRILQQPGWPQNVIDIDTYGSPWNHWTAMLENVASPLTVFLTIGKPILAAGGRSLSNAERESVGINFTIPAAFGPKLVELSTDFMLAHALKAAKIIECVEVTSTGNARYIGVRLEPLKNGSQEASTSSEPKHRKAVKEQCNV